MKRPGRPMFRVVLLLLAWTTAGAIVNVAVAWGNSLAYQHRMQLSPLILAPFRPATSRPAALSSDWQQMHMIAAEDQFANRMEQFADSSDRALLTNFHSGWPMLSASGSIRTDSTGPFVIQPHVLINRGSTIYCLPVIPIWPGFAFNTLFYAVILWGLFAAPFALRRRRRIKRGLCPKCAYDLRGRERGRSPASDSSVCPECGTAAK